MADNGIAPARELHPLDKKWREFAEKADRVAEQADALLVMAREIGNPSAMSRARDLRDGALDLYNTYKNAGDRGESWAPGERIE